MEMSIDNVRGNRATELLEHISALFTKEEVIAMLTDIQSEFKEGLRCKGCCNNCVNACEDIPAGWFLDFIDAKINSLKENTDGATNN